jgi:hypothetical protein
MFMIQEAPFVETCCTTVLAKAAPDTESGIPLAETGQDG